MSLPGDRSDDAADRRFSRLYATHAEHVLSFFARRTFDPQLALDLTAETFAVAFEQRRRFRGSSDEAAEAWLYGIAHNLLRRYLRRGYAARRALRRLEMWAPVLAPDDFARVEQLAVLEHVRDAVRRGYESLPAGQRDAVRLRVIEDRSYQEVAEMLHISQASARVRVCRALRRLEVALSDVESLSEVAG